MRKETCLKEAILETESERKAREDAEIEKIKFGGIIKHLKMIFIRELNKNDELTKQMNEALRQREEVGREKTNTSK